MHHLDLFTGIGGFHLAAMRCGFHTLCASEMDPYNCELIDRNLGLDNCGNIELAVIPRRMHPYSVIEEDIVPVEITGITDLTIDDFMEEILPFSDIITGGFPCQDVSPANTMGNRNGIDGEQSSLEFEQLRIIEELNPPYCIFENSRNLVSRGLDRICAYLSRLGYLIEFETISATAFGYPHYRHRLYLVAYLPGTEIAQRGIRGFDEITKELSENPRAFKIPLMESDPDSIKRQATVENPRSIARRSKRINGLGNAIIPDIAEAIFRVIKECDPENTCDRAMNPSLIALPPVSDHGLRTELVLSEEGWIDEQQHLFDTGKPVTSFPPAGFIRDNRLYSTGTRNAILNPTNTTYDGLYYTLTRKDGNNNGNPSRKSRPGGLGGLNGQMEGALNPEWCEVFMGYPVGYTKLAESTSEGAK